MAAAVAERLSTSRGRRFGFTVGGAFLLLAAIAWWRGHALSSTVFTVLGSLLVVAGALVPRQLGPVEAAWMGLAHAISKVTTPIVMAILWLLVITPAAWLRRLIGGNPLVRAERDGSYWRPRPDGERRTKSLQRQF